MSENEGLVTETIQVRAIFVFNLQANIRSLTRRVGRLAEQWGSQFTPRSAKTTTEALKEEMKAMITKAWQQNPGLTRVQLRTKPGPLALMVAQEWIDENKSMYFDDLMENTRKGLYEMKITVWCPHSPCFLTLNLVGPLLNGYALLSLHKKMLYTNEETAMLRASDAFQQDLENLLSTKIQAGDAYVTTVEMKGSSLKQVFTPGVRGALYEGHGNKVQNLVVPTLSQSDLIMDDDSDALSFSDDWPEDMRAPAVIDDSV